MVSAQTKDLDYRRLVKANRAIERPSPLPAIRIAIISDAASQQFVPLLRTLFHENGLAAEIYEGAFDALEIEVFDAASALYQFGPDIVVFAGCVQALRARYYQQDASTFLQDSIDRMMNLWSALRMNSTARIIQMNYPAPYERQFGNFDLKVPHSLYATVAALNVEIARSAREESNVLVCDVEAIASWVGRSNWYDDRLWNMTKAFCNLEYLPRVAQSLVEIVLASRGRVIKCVILDLDNTLWGGVVGDDGPLGVAIGAHGDGEPFYHFQNYLLSLKQRGILLAVCSKNSLETAVRPFLENPDMALKRDDITVFVANWEHKAGNIQKIRDTLEIGLDSMMFLDDNPFERNLVREFLPDVIVPELPEDPADYVRAVSELNLFETSSFSAEDVTRSELYKVEANRREQQSTFSNLDEYLQSLNMRIEVARFDSHKIPRIAQLIQRSNQFNLTTRRYNEAQCEQMMLDEESVVPLSASLQDRFGDHGLISVIVLRVHEDKLEISDWLMSCRVLARGVEHFLMTRAVELAKEKGLSLIQGRYIPTAKNAMVKDFFGQFGFAKVAESDGHSEWHLDPAVYEARNVFISEAGGV